MYEGYEYYCEVCERNIKNSEFGTFENTKAWNLCGVVVEEVEKKQCCKCRGHTGLEMFSGENAICNGPWMSCS